MQKHYNRVYIGILGVVYGKWDRQCKLLFRVEGDGLTTNNQETLSAFLQSLAWRACSLSEPATRSQTMKRKPRKVLGLQAKLIYRAYI